MKQELKDLVMAAIEENAIAKSKANLEFENSGNTVNVEFELIVSIKSVTLNGETKTY